MQLTVFTVWSGGPDWNWRAKEYTVEYPERLARGIRRHLPETVDVRLVCITDFPLPAGWDEAEPIEPFHHKDEEGCWPKVQLFKPRAGACLHIDLDSIVTGDLSPFIAPPGAEQLFARHDPSRKGHFNSFLMAWNGESPKLHRIWAEREAWNQKNLRFGKPAGKWNGDQDFIRAHAGTWSEFPAEMLPSYKMECNPGRIPEESRVILFHGKPKLKDLDPGSPYAQAWTS